MRALIDADNVAIACAWSAEEENEDIATSRAGLFVEGILHDTGATEYELWLSGVSNFRHNVYPEYKANRINMPRPKWEAEVKQYLVDHWGAERVDGIEADDILGIRYNECDNAILCHLDKDLDQIAGTHFSWELKRKGVVIREKEIYTMDPDHADYMFFYQLLVGDPTDNIKGVNGVGPKKAAGLLHGCTNNQERYEVVLDRYASEEELDMNAQCVYIWRKHKDNWRNIIGDTR